MLKSIVLRVSAAYLVCAQVSYGMETVYDAFSIADSQAKTTFDAATYDVPNIVALTQKVKELSWNPALTESLTSVSLSP